MQSLTRWKILFAGWTKSEVDLAARRDKTRETKRLLRLDDTFASILSPCCSDWREKESHMDWKRCLIAAATVGCGMIATSALANTGQEQACAGSVSERTGIPMSEIRVAGSEGSHSGVTEIDLTYHGGHAVCMVDRNYNVLDVHYSRRPERSHHHDEGPEPDQHGQEQACAARMAQEVNEPMSAVRVISSSPFLMRSRQVQLRSPGMAAQCTADVHNRVVYFKFQSG